MTFGEKAVRAIAGLAFLVVTFGSAERAAAQPRLLLEVRPEIVTRGTRCEAVVTGARPSASLRLFASVTTGAATVGPWATECGDVRFSLLLGGNVRHIAVADGIADGNGSARLQFRIPPRLPDRYNGIKVYFQVGAALAVPDGTGGCTIRTLTSNVDCSTVDFGLN